MIVGLVHLAPDQLIGVHAEHAEGCIETFRHGDVVDLVALEFGLAANHNPLTFVQPCR